MIIYDISRQITRFPYISSLVVSTPLKHISQLGKKLYIEKKNAPNHQPVSFFLMKAIPLGNYATYRGSSSHVYAVEHYIKKKPNEPTNNQFRINYYMLKSPCFMVKFKLFTILEC